MMKSKSLIFLSLLLLLPSCQKNKNEDLIPLFHYQQKESSFCYYTKDDFDDLIEHNESSIIYILASGCTSCDLFSHILKSYIKEYQILFPLMYSDEFLQSEYSFHISDSCLLFINNGKITDYKTDFSSIGSKKELSSFLKTKTIDSTITIKNDVKDSTSLSDFPCFSLLSKSRKDLEKEDSYLFIKESKMESFTSIYSYCKEKKISSLVFNEKEQSYESEIFSIPYKSSTYLEIHFDNKNVSYYQYLNTLLSD